jgi:hypothetical protein
VVGLVVGLVVVVWEGLSEDWVDWWDSFSKSLEAENRVSALWEDESLMMIYGVGMVLMDYRARRACETLMCGMIGGEC